MWQSNLPSKISKSASTTHEPTKTHPNSPSAPLHYAIIFPNGPKKKIAGILGSPSPMWNPTPR